MMDKCPNCFLIGGQHHPWCKNQNTIEVPRIHKDLKMTQKIIEESKPITLEVKDAVFREAPKLPHPSKPGFVNVMCLEFSTMEQCSLYLKVQKSQGWEMWMMGTPVNNSRIGVVLIREVQEETKNEG